VWTLLRRTALAVAVFLGVLIAAFVTVVSIGIRVDLDFLRAPAETFASTALGRDVTIRGPMMLVPTWSPTVEVQGLGIANPAGWTSEEFAHMELARVTVGILPILARRAVVRELTASGVRVRLERERDGRINWLLGLPEPEEAPDEPAAETPSFDLDRLLVRSVLVEQLRLRDVVVEYRDAVSGREDRFELARLDGTLGTHAPLRLGIGGRIGDEPYELGVSGGPPIDLLRGDAPWPFDLALDVVDTTLSLRTVVEEPIPLGLGERQDPASSAATDALPLLPSGRRFGKIDVSANGDALENLERLVAVDLPPWGPVAFDGSFEAFEGGVYDADIEVRVGSSSLSGRLEARTGEPPRVEVALSAPRVQLDDFDTAGWSPVADGGAAPAEDAGAGARAAGSRAPLLSPEVLSSVDGTLSVTVEHVASGRDRLGRGSFKASLEKGHLQLRPLRLEVPGGSATLGLSLHPTPRKVSAEITASVERFDYGILARRLDPETQMRGLFGLDVALSSAAPTVEALMQHANGHFDFAVFPEDIDADLVDLWAVSLLTAIVPAVDQSERSKLNCVVGLFDVQDGVMRDHTLMLDTSNMTVGGVATIDFRERHISMQLAPRAKRPELFALATPVRVEGSFDDFGIGVGAADVLGTVVSFVTSIVHVPIRLIFQTRTHEDDMAECLAAIDRASGS
jgi:hypothetical protein